MIENFHPNDLVAHPLNAVIYSEQLPSEFVESVRTHGVFPDHPIGYVLTEQGRQIVSGHRRWSAAKLVGLDDIPCVRLTEIENSEIDIRERVILSNRQRVKTNAELALEATELMQIEQQRTAAQRGREQPKAASVETPRDRAKSRTRVAEALGVSASTAGRLARVGQRLEELTEAGKTEEAEQLKEVVNQSVRTGFHQATGHTKSAGPGTSKQNKLDSAGSVARNWNADWEKFVRDIVRFFGARLEHNRTSEAQRSERRASHILNELDTAVRGWKE